jgi:hypothetical protein
MQLYYQIKPTELKIGSQVELLTDRSKINLPTGQIATVIEIRQDKVRLEFKFSTSDKSIIINRRYNTIRPIILTDEILTELGLTERKDGNHFSYWWLGKNPVTHDWMLCLKQFKDEDDYFYHNGYHKIKFLHHLQALYSDLCPNLDMLSITKLK